VLVHDRCAQSLTTAKLMTCRTRTSPSAVSERSFGSRTLRKRSPLEIDATQVRTPYRHCLPSNAEWGGHSPSTVTCCQPSAAKLTAMYLITGAAGFSGSVSDSVVELLRGKGEQVRAMVRRDNARANRLREGGAEVVVGDLSSPADVVDAMRDVTRVFFSTNISFDYLQETAIVCAATRELGGLEVLVNKSQMTVSQMTLTSSEESRQQRLHWLSEQIMNWSGVPVVHVRPTVLLDSPMFTVLARRSVRDRDVLALPFGTGRTSPIAAEDVARVVAALLLNPPKVGVVYGLTGPEVLDIKGLAEQYSRALGRTISAEDIPYDDWVRHYLRNSGLSDLVQQHLATMARLHRENRYDRSTHDVERVTGQPPQTVGQYVASRPELFA
jgi:uncharacterized protein YbjT (DUF2867 family)